MSISFTFMHIQNVYISHAHLNNLTKQCTPNRLAQSSKDR
jgi:hypothetical protein